MGRSARVTVVVLALSAAPAHADDALIATGRVIAAQNCSRCHAIGPDDLSPNPKSPPFRTLAQRYPLSYLEEALGEGIMVGHEGLEMPNFRLDAAQIEALLAFLESIQKK
jgi:mono/diheme cytochrome c family protein